MISKKLFLDRYLDLHERLFPKIIESLPEKKLRASKDSLNSIIWIYWHIIRTEDVGISRFILDEPQVYDSFMETVGVKTTLNGTGMSLDEVHKITRLIKLEGLELYRRETFKKTLALISNQDKVNLLEIPSNSRVKEIICKENIMPQDSWSMLPLYYNKTKEWFLLHVSLTHPFYHLGQIQALSKF